MVRHTQVVVLVVALFGSSVVLAGPTVRRDEVANVVTEAEPVKLITVPVKLPPMVADEQASETTTVKQSEELEPSSTTTVTDQTTELGPTSTPTTTTKPTPETTSSSSSSSSSSSGTSGPVYFTKPPRKTITFDQRQEGKYNIRADLENFVIVVVPSGSSSGASLLDLLTRSAQKKDAFRQHQYHHHHHHQETNRKSNGKRKKNHKTPYGANAALQKKAPQGPVTPEVIVLDESNQRSGQLVAEEFIEGRTPYKVDLSSSARSVDGEPNHQQQTFRFSVEPAAPASVVRSTGGLVRFPPVTSGNYPRSSGNAGNGRALRAIGAESESFANTNTLVVAASSSSSSTTNNNNYHYHQRPQQQQQQQNHQTFFNLPGDGIHGNQQQQQQPLPTQLAEPTPTVLRRTEDNDNLPATGTRGGIVANHSHLPSSFDSLVYEPSLRSDVDMKQLQLQPDYSSTSDADVDANSNSNSNSNAYADADGDVDALGLNFEDLPLEQRQRPDPVLDGGWDELRLLGAQEQCGPDRKRDSYGVCQFVRP